jgi:hypothetical protein
VRVLRTVGSATTRSRSLTSSSCSDAVARSNRHVDENQFSLKQLVAGVAVSGAACFVIVKMSQIEALRGPLLFVVDPAPPNKAFGLVAVPVLALGMFSVFVKPHVVTTFVCSVSVLLWLAIGVVGVGIKV